jgi:sterol-4alpha-carboxylate 3-dehydrogenase (decarboxylating)
LLQASRKGQSRFQVGSNDNLFDWSYVGNVAHAHLLAAVGLLATSKLSIEPLDTEKIDGEAFFITNDSPMYFWDFARRVWLEGGDTLGVNPNKVWVLSAGFALAIATIAELVLGLFGKTPNLTRMKVRFSVMTRYFSIAKAKQRLGYTPIVSVEEGIRRGVRDVLKKEALDKANASTKKVQ